MLASFRRPKRWCMRRSIRVAATTSRPCSSSIPERPPAGRPPMRLKKSPMSAPLKWTLHANPVVSIQAMQSVLLLMCPKTGSKGTGFLLTSGCVVTTAHVVERSRPGDIWGLDARGRRMTFSRVIADAGVDLALLRPSEPTFGDFELAAVGKLELGLPLWAWGFPFGYVGPTPLVSVGHVAGYSAKRVRRRLVPQVVINGAFNVGNSGGPFVCRRRHSGCRSGREQTHTSQSFHRFGFEGARPTSGRASAPRNSVQGRIEEARSIRAGGPGSRTVPRFFPGDDWRSGPGK